MTNDGGPVWPNEYNMTTESGRSTPVPGAAGLTIRDYFAGLAMQAIIQREGTGSDVVLEAAAGPDVVRDARLFAPNDAARAYVVADAMLAERDKK